MVFFIRGYKVLAEAFQKPSLKNAVYAYFILEFIVSILLLGIIFFDLNKTYSELFIGLPTLVLIGTAELVLGLGVTKLKDHLGSFANTLRILKIVNGCFLISVILSPIAIFIAIPVLILEVVFIFNMANNKKFHYS